MGALLRWLDSRIDRVVQDRLRDVIITHEDPLRVFGEQRDAIRKQLLESANVVGRDVIVGQDVVIWGGKVDGHRGVELHDHVRLYNQCSLVVDHLAPESGIVLEERVAVNFRCYVDGAGGVRIGRRSILGPNVVIVSSGHRVDPDVPVQASGKELASVHLGEDVWVGANVVILKGVRIGDRAVIGAGSVVTDDVPGDAVAVGSPARVIRHTRT